MRQEEDSFPLRLLQVLTPVLLASLLYPMPASAADLKPETTYAWQEYLKSAEARSQKHLAQGNPFISIDTDAVEAAKLRRGESLVSPAAPKVPIKIPGGLIHDWTGAIFIPNASVPDILRVTRDYARYSTLYRPTVWTVSRSRTASVGKSLFDGGDEQVVLREKRIGRRLSLDVYSLERPTLVQLERNDHGSGGR